MFNRRATLPVLALLSWVLVLAAACGPATGPAADPVIDAAAEATSALPAGVESAGSAPVTGAPTAALDGSIVYNADGVEIGFTKEGRPYIGNLEAPVVIEEFSDFQCPFCSRFARETLPDLLANQVANNEAVLIYYDFPLTGIHPQAAAAANAARCAGEQGPQAYWDMHDRLFADIAAWSNGNPGEVFTGFAAELGLDISRFEPCLAEDRYAAEIEADMAVGRQRGVSSTPSFFLNDQPLIGAQPLAVFEDAVARVGAGETIAAAPEAAPDAPVVKPTPAVIAENDSAAERGDPNAPITIVEFTDYQCPYCTRHAQQTLPRLLSEMVDAGRIRYVIKDFPLDDIHPEARAAAVAARCAGEQDAYWPMHDALFARQDEWGGAGDEAARLGFLAIAADLKLDEAAFASCLDGGKYDQIVQDNQDEGIALGVRGTPTFFIAGFPVGGAQPYELFEYAVGLAEEGTLADAYVPREAEAPPTPSGPVEVVETDAFSIGETSAPVTIVEFTDFQCPYCYRHFEQTFPQIKANYIDAGLVRYVFMDFPLTNIHPQAFLAAQAARCAGEQDAYLEMHGELFGGQQSWSGRGDAADVFTGYAETLGLDAGAFRQCLDDERYAPAVQADMDQAISLGVTGTPGFFLNGNLLSGAQPYSTFERAIEQLLAQTE